MSSPEFRKSFLVENVPVDIFASPGLWMDGTAVEQLKSVARFAGMRRVVGLPDLHPGRGYPVGSAALACDVIVPLLIDKDLGCGMQFWNLGSTRINPAKIRKKIEDRFFSWDGVTASPAEFIALLEKPSAGAEFLASQFPESAEAIRLLVARAYRVTEVSAEPVRDLLDEAFVQSAMRSLGTIGEGNHFVEVQRVEQVVDEGVAASFGLQTDNAVVMVHSGSRSFGYSLAERLLVEAEQAGRVVPIGSDTAQRYLCAMQLALNFAAFNRLILLLRLSRHLSLEQIAPILDKPHNFVELAKEPDNHWCVLHRKGAAPASGRDGSADPAIIPGSLGNPSWFCVAGPNTEDSLRSLNHGAGRKWSRTVAAEKLRQKAQIRGTSSVTGKVEVICKNRDTIFEEGGDAYKDVESVMASAEGAGLAKPVAKVVPLLTIKE